MDTSGNPREVEASGGSHTQGDPLLDGTSSSTGSSAKAEKEVKGLPSLGRPKKKAEKAEEAA